MSAQLKDPEFIVKKFYLSQAFTFGGNLYGKILYNQPSFSFSSHHVKNLSAPT